jgi:cysteine-rich repeat protein
MSKVRLLAALVAVLVAAGVENSSADVAADRCGGSKSKAAAKYARALFQCHSAALRDGESADPECVAKATGKLATAFGQAESIGGCATTGDEAGAQSIVDAARSAIDALLAPDASEEALACASTKLKTSGRHIQARLGCYGKAALRSLPPASECLAMSYERLVSGFSKAEGHGGCTNTGDLDAARDIDEDAVESLVRALSPVCGDAIQGPGQECEGGEDDACPGLCSQACECVFPPECGDGEAELPEECDDGNLMSGDGCSDFCQLEDASALCSGVAAASGTSIDAMFVSSSFAAPTFLTAPPLDATRLFVVEREGYIRVLHLADNSVNATPFLDVSDLTTTGGERGCFSMAFDPDYESNGRFYLSCTNTSGDLVLARYEVEPGNPELADESTRKELVLVPHPGASNHNGGQIQFGGDGYLYWSMGDGGGPNSQDDASMLGKLLRIDVDHDTAPFATVPPTNPHYVDGTTDLESIWAKGLRNPWRFSFDRLTGDLYIGDVGAGDREEIDYAPASSTGGQNYGWPIFEGTTCNNGPCPDPPTGFTFPIHEYPHGGPCAVMGGYVYRGCAMPDLAGTYFFSDLCAAYVHTFEVVGGAVTNFMNRTTDAKSAGASFTGVVSWGQDARGEIYLINGNNSIYRMEPE